MEIYAMTLQDLIDQLQNLIDNGTDPDTKVILATQSNYPMDYNIAGVVSGDDLPQENGDEDDDEEEAKESSCVYIAEGEQIGYGTKRVWEAL